MKKKVFLIFLTCIMVVTCVITISAIEFAETSNCCSKFGGYTYVPVDGTHLRMGSGCTCTEQMICWECKTVFATYPVTYAVCPH